MWRIGDMNLPRHARGGAAFQSEIFRYRPLLHFVMKAATVSFTLSLLATTAVFAEDQAPAPAAVPAPEAPLRLSLPGSPSAPGAATDNLGLIPETPETAPKPKGNAIPEAKPSRKASDAANKTTIAEDELAARIRLRQLKTRVLAEPKVQESLQQAQAAKTDYERREAMKAYYKLLYGRIEQLDSSLKKQVNERRSAAVNRLQQANIRPTKPLQPGS
jgi:hypothetical protein